MFSIVTDASGLGIGAVLQVKRDGQWEAAAFYSRQTRGRAALLGHRTGGSGSGGVNPTLLVLPLRSCFCYLYTTLLPPHIRQIESAAETNLPQATALVGRHPILARQGQRIRRCPFQRREDETDSRQSRAGHQSSSGGCGDTTPT